MHLNPILALFIAFGGLAYHVVFILSPADLQNRRTPAIVAIISWALLGIVGGTVIPVTYVLWEDYVLSCIVGMALVLSGATLGHIVLGITRRRAQADASYIAMQVFKERSEE